MSSYSDDYKNSQTQLNALTRRLYEIDEEKMPLTALEVKSLLDDALAFISNSPRELDLTVECYSIRDAFKRIRFSLPADLIDTLFQESHQYAELIKGKSFGKKHTQYAHMVMSGVFEAYRDKFSGLLAFVDKESIGIEPVPNYPAIAFHTLLINPRTSLKKSKAGSLTLIKVMVEQDLVTPAEIAETLTPGKTFSEFDTYLAMSLIINEMNNGEEMYIDPRVRSYFHPSMNGREERKPFSQLAATMIEHHIYMKLPEKNGTPADLNLVNYENLSDKEFIQIGRALIADCFVACDRAVGFLKIACNERPGMTMDRIVSDTFVSEALDYCISRYEYDSTHKENKASAKEAMLILYQYSQPNPALISTPQSRPESIELMSALMAEFTRHKVNFNQEKPASKHKADFNNLVL